jgi:hypothetical protein
MEANNYFKDTTTLDEFNQKLLQIDKDTLNNWLLMYLFNPQYTTQDNIIFNNNEDEKYNFNFFIKENDEKYYLNYEYILSIVAQITNNMLTIKKNNKFPFEFVSILGIVFYKHFQADIFI